jgi:hypothetical protein
MVGPERECIDGQNRLLTIRQYIEQTPANKDDKSLFFWKVTDHENTTVHHIYYKETPEFADYVAAKASKRSRGYKKKYRAMTTEEQTHFHEYEVIIQIINTPLTMEDRKNMFNRWQNGTSISQCDSYKNSDYPFCQWTLAHKMEARFADRLGSVLKSGRKNWLYDLYRLLQVFLKKSEKDIFISSLQVRNAIEKEHKETFNEKDYTTAADLCETFLNVVEIPKGVVNLSILISVMYYWNALTNDTYRSTLERTSCIKEFIETIKSVVPNKTMNNGVDTPPVWDAYPLFEQQMTLCIQKHVAMTTLPTPTEYKKKPLATVLRQSVWDTYIGKEKGEGACLCCASSIRPTNFEAGHVVAEACGGLNTIENLRPVCRKCNANMKIEHMETWMHRNFPGRLFK